MSARIGKRDDRQPRVDFAPQLVKRGLRHQSCYENSLMKMRIGVLAASVLLVATGRGVGQVTGQVYHAVGPAMFTNATVWGYPNGLLAGSNFVCGVYVGTLNQALKPGFGQPGGSLKRPLNASQARLWGLVVADAPPVLLQFRVWPAAFGSYEEAVAWSNPSPPVGESEIVLALPLNEIVEFPVQTGPMWLAPLVASGGAHGPLACRLAAGSLILSWPTNSGNWFIVGAGSLAPNAVWSPVPGPVVVTNGYNQAIVPLTNQFQFFRLSR